MDLRVVGADRWSALVRTAMGRRSCCLPARAWLGWGDDRPAPRVEADLPFAGILHAPPVRFARPHACHHNRCPR
ncbi:hypothetical protein SMG44B_20126 [Stenotrophomonas maltophilia]